MEQCRNGYPRGRGRTGVLAARTHGRTTDGSWLFGLEGQDVSVCLGRGEEPPRLGEPARKRVEEEMAAAVFPPGLVLLVLTGSARG